MLIALLAAIGIVVSPQLVFAQNTINVYPGDSIQAAIDFANNGDTVLVQPGIYTENINFKGKAIRVTSSDPLSTTIIDGAAAASVVTFNSNEGASSVLNGFTIQNGSAEVFGGGILVQSASPTITNNIIQNNAASSGGGGIAVNGGSPKIQDNQIQNNTQTASSGGPGGGGILIVSAGSAQLLGNRISQNTWPGGSGGGISLFAAGTPIIKNNTISGNTAGDLLSGQGGGIYIVNQSDALILQNVITNNTAGEGAAIYFLVPAEGRGPALVNNTIMSNSNNVSYSMVFASGFDSQVQIWNNFLISDTGPALVCDGTYSLQPPTIANNYFATIYPSSDPMGSCAGQVGQNGNIEAGSLSGYPSFADYPTDLRLLVGSAGIDAGSNAAPYLEPTDPDGHPRTLDGNNDCVSTADIGAYEYMGSANAAFTSSTLTFPSQFVGTQSGARKATLTNSGNTCFQITGSQATGDFSAPYNHCSAGLRGGSSCTFDVYFTPTATGARTGALTVTGTDGATASSPSIVLQGTGTGPALSLSPSSLTFVQPVMGPGIPQSVTLTNISGSPLSILGIATASPFNQGNNCPPSLAANATCTINVTFSSFSVGTQTGQLTIYHNASGSPQSVGLSGSATVFAVNVTPTAISVKHGQTAKISVAVLPVVGAFNASVALSCTSVPRGVSCGVTPASVVPGSSGANSALVLNTSGSTPRGNFTIDVIGKSGSLMYPTSFVLTVY